MKLQGWKGISAGTMHELWQRWKRTEIKVTHSKCVVKQTVLSKTDREGVTKLLVDLDRLSKQ